MWRFNNLRLYEFRFAEVLVGVDFKWIALIFISGCQHIAVIELVFDRFAANDFWVVRFLFLFCFFVALSRLIQVFIEQVRHHIIPIRAISVIEVVVFDATAIVWGPLLLHDLKALGIASDPVLDLQKRLLTLVLQCWETLVLTIAPLGVIRNQTVSHVLISLS